MFCKHSIIKNENQKNNRNYLYCDVSKEMCPLVRYCITKGKVVNIDNYDKKCIIYKTEGDKTYMTQGKYKVLYEKRGMLYIELDYDTSIRVPNPFGSDIPKGVDLVKIKDEYYIKGYEPKIEPKMVTSTNKKNKIKD